MSCTAKIYTAPVNFPNRWRQRLRGPRTVAVFALPGIAEARHGPAVVAGMNTGS